MNKIPEHTVKKKKVPHKRHLTVQTHQALTTPINNTT